MASNSDPRKYIEILDGPLMGSLGSIIPDQKAEGIVFAVVYKHRNFTPPIGFHSSHVEETDLATWSKRHNTWARLFGQILTVVSGALMVLWQFFHLQIALYILLMLVFSGLLYAVWAILKWRRLGICPSCRTRLTLFGVFHCQICGWTRPMPDYLDATHLAAYMTPLPKPTPSLLPGYPPSASLPNPGRSE
jgi:hypothetical protein